MDLQIILFKNINFAAMHDFEIINFSIFGLDLQEPMAFITNGFITIFSIYAVWNISSKNNANLVDFKWFFLFLGISTFFGALGHVFFKYTDLYGKIPSWTFAIVAGYYAGVSVLSRYGEQSSDGFLKVFLIIKSIVLLFLGIATLKFLFIAIDAILTYLFYCGFLAYRIWKQGDEGMKYFVFGVIILFPSAFIFLLNWNVHTYLNRDDLSHLLMLGCIILFYRGVMQIHKSEEEEIEVIKSNY